MLKAISGLAIANVTVQALQLVAQPLLAHFYAPANFGLLAQVMAVSTFVAVIATLQIHNYLVLSKDDAEVSFMTNAGLTFALITSFLFLALLFFSPSSFFSGNTDSEIAILATVILLAVSFSNMLRGNLTATGSFKMMTYYSVARGAFVIVAQISMGAVGFDRGLIYGLLLGEVVAQLALPSRKLLFRTGFSLTRQHLYDIFSRFKQQSDFLLSSTIQELVSVAIFVTPLYLMTKIFGLQTGGQFGMAHKMGWAPILLVAQSVSPVIYRHMASIPKQDLCKNRLLSWKVPGVAFVIFSIAAWFAAKPIFLFFFGERWSAAADMTSWLTIWALSFVSVLTFRICYRVLNKMRMQLYIDAFMLILLSLIFYYADMAGSTATVKYLSLAGVFQNLLIACVMRRYTLMTGRSIL